MRSVLKRFTAAVALVLVVTACATGGNGGSAITSLTIDQTSPVLVVGDTLQLTATVTATGGASEAVLWTSSVPTIASVTSDGLVTALDDGSTNITATSVADPSRSDIIAVTVNPAGVLLWTRQFGTPGQDETSAIATDASGHVYVVGETGGNLAGTNAGERDGFIRSFNADGNVRWTHQFGTNLMEYVHGVALDAVGNVYAVGSTTGDLEGTKAGFGDDAFIRSLDADGNLRWTRQFGSASDDDARAVATDPSGNVYIGGVTFGALGGANAGGVDGYVRAYDSEGDILWIRQFGTANDDLVESIAVDEDGNVYAAGYTDGDLQGGNSGGYDVFVRAFDADGNVRWTRQFGSAANDFAGGIAVDASGHVYVAGRTAGDVGGINVGSSDAFVRSYDATGTVRWTRQFGTSSFDAANGIATGPQGDVYVAGSTVGALEGSNAGELDAFVRAYDDLGGVRWTRQYGTSSFDDARAVATDTDGNVYATGRTDGLLEGSGAGFIDAYVRKYGR